MEILKIKDKQFFDDIFVEDQDGHYRANPTGEGGIPITIDQYSTGEFGTFFNQNTDTFELTDFCYNFAIYGSTNQWHLSMLLLNCDEAKLNVEGTDLLLSENCIIGIVFRNETHFQIMFSEFIEEMSVSFVTESGEIIQCEYDWKFLYNIKNCIN